MAEQSSHDVVNQSRSGGDLSPSDVPASKPENISSGGDAEGVDSITNKSQTAQMSANISEHTSGASGSMHRAHSLDSNMNFEFMAVSSHHLVICVSLY